MRLAVAVLLVQGAAISWTGSQPWASVLRCAAAVCIGIGFMMPAFGLVVAIAELAWMIINPTETWSNSFLIASILIALAVLGPGAYSIDRLLFGRKRLTIGRSPR